MIEYLTKKELKVLYPEYIGAPSVTQVLKDPRQEAFFKKAMKDKESCLYKATIAGTKAHTALETGISKDEMTEAVLDCYKSTIGCDIDETIGKEKTVVHPLVYNGRFDAVVEFQGEVHLIDYKKTNKKKTPSSMKKYFQQLMAYKIAHEFLYPQLMIAKVSIFNIFGVTPDSVDSKVTTLTNDEMRMYLDMFTTRLVG